MNHYTFQDIWTCIVKRSERDTWRFRKGIRSLDSLVSSYDAHVLICVLLRRQNVL